MWCDMWGLGGFATAKGVVKLVTAGWKRCEWVCDVDAKLVDLGRLATWKVDRETKRLGTTGPTQSNRFSALVGCSAHFTGRLYGFDFEHFETFSEFGANWVFESGNEIRRYSDSLKFYGFWANTDDKWLSFLFFYKVSVTASVDISFIKADRPFQF